MASTGFDADQVIGSGTVSGFVPQPDLRRPRLSRFLRISSFLDDFTDAGAR